VDAAAAVMSISIPAGLQPREYLTGFDMVSESACWFSDPSLHGPPTHRLQVRAALGPSASMYALQAASLAAL
jgi:hypothetical protein